VGSMGCWVWDARLSEREKQLERIKVIIYNFYSINLTF